MYAGDVECGSTAYNCLTRKKIGVHKFRTTLDAYADLQVATQAVCVMKAPPVPINVLMANSEFDRPLDHPDGWFREGYMGRLNNRANNINGYYQPTQKNNMGRRTPSKRAIYEESFMVANPVVDGSVDRWKTRREVHGTSPIMTGTLEDHLRTKRFSSMAVGIGGLVVSQIAQLITTVVVADQVSGLEDRIEAVNLDSKTAYKRVSESVSLLAKEVDLNGRFDEIGQVQDIVEKDTRVLESIMSSVSRNVLDSTTRQEGMAIVTRTLETQLAFLTTAEAQTVTTLTTQAQSAEVEVGFDDNSGLCVDAEREVRFITAIPLMSNSNNYCGLEDENTFGHCDPVLGEEDTTYEVNPHNDFQKTIIQDGRAVRMVTKTFQIWPGTTIRFEQSDNKMEDVFTIFLDKELSIEGQTWCDGEFADIILTNASRVSNPLQCGIFIPNHIFFRGVEVRMDGEVRKPKGILEQLVNEGGLVVTIDPHEVEEKVNITMNKPFETTMMKAIATSSKFTTTTIVMMVGGMVGASIMATAMTHFLKKWMKIGRTGEVVPQVEVEEQANAPVDQVNAGLRELGFNDANGFNNADAEHQWTGNKVTLVYSKNY